MRPILNTEACTALQAFILENIPLSRSMQVSVNAPDPEALRLCAPLEANLNDKGSAFGGSLSAMATLTGWGLVWIAARQQSMNVDIVVASSQQRYLRPVTQSIETLCHVPEPFIWSNFAQELPQRGRASIKLHGIARNLGDSQPGMEFSARFVAILRD